MSTSTQTATTVTNLGVVMFTVSDVDAALAFYTGTLGYEVRADDRFGEHGEARWVEVAPPGSTARIALNHQMADEPIGAGCIGVESPDVRGEHARLTGLGAAVGDLMEMPGAPLMFRAADPDGNAIWVVAP